MADPAPIWQVLGIQPPAEPTQQPGQPATVAPDQPAGVPAPSAFSSALGLPDLQPKSTQPSNPNLPFLSRTWRSIYNLGDEALSGAARGARDVIDPMAETLARGATAIGLGGIGPTPQQTQAGDIAARNAYNQNYGDSTVADIGRIGGQIATTAPMLMGPLGLGRAVTAGAEAIPGALGSAARFLTGATPASGIVERGLQLASQGAGTGAAMGALTSGQSDASLPSQIAQGAIGGAVLGPVAGTLAGGARALTGVAGGIDPTIARLAQQWQENLGITPPVTKLSSNPTMRLLTNQLGMLPGAGGVTADAAVRRQIASTLAQEMGQNADNIGPEVMGNALTDLNQGFTDFVKKTPNISAYDSTGSNALMDKINDIRLQALGIPLPQDSMNIVSQQAKNIESAFANPVGPSGAGSVTPEGFLALTAKDGQLQRAYDAAPSSAKPYIAGMQDALYDRLADAVPPDEVQGLSDLRYKWRVMKTAAQAQSPTGDVQIGRLSNAIQRASQQYDTMPNQFAYNADPNNTLNLIARGGQQFMGILPDSGTAARLTASSLPRMATALLTSGATAPLTSLMRSQWLARNAIRESLGQPTLLGSALPTSQDAVLPSAALGNYMREQARQNFQP